MKNFLYYLKISSIFIIIELFITFIISLLNLLGIDNNITNTFLLIINTILVLLINYKNASIKKKKGIIEGIKIFILLLFILLLIKIIFINYKFNVTTIIYYIILLISSIIGALLGVNKKNND